MISINDFSDIPYEDPDNSRPWLLRPSNEWNLDLTPNLNFDQLENPAVSWRGPKVEIEVRSVFDWTSPDSFDTKSVIFQGPRIPIIEKGMFRKIDRFATLSEPFFAGHTAPTRWRMFVRFPSYGTASIGLILEHPNRAITARNIYICVLMGKVIRQRILHAKCDEKTFHVNHMEPLLINISPFSSMELTCIRCVMTIPEMTKTTTYFPRADDLLCAGEDFTWLLVSANDSDSIIFLEEGASLRVHKLILGARSEVFERMFRRKEHLFFKIKRPIMYEFLKYMYSGKLYYSCPHIIKKIKALAFTFRMKELEDAIMDYLSVNTPDNPRGCDMCDPSGILRQQPLPLTAGLEWQQNT